MRSFVSQHKGAVVFSIAFHVAIAGALVLNLKLPSWDRPLATAAPIAGVLIDEGAIEREQQRREDVRRQESQRRQHEERQRQDAAKRADEQRQRDREEAARREQVRVETDRQKAQQAEQRRQEQVAREKREREEAARAEAAKRAQEERARQQAENQLQEQLRAEAERASAVRAGLLDEYIARIQNDIELNWARPASAQPGLNCVVNVVQIPSGDVMDVRVASCNGDAAVVRSIEVAVRKASPLPLPKDMSLFDRNLNVTFRPDP